MIRRISPDHTQTLEVMGTQAFEEFVRQLEKEGVGINVVREPPPLSVKIAPEKSRLEYDIEIPQTQLRYTRNYKKISSIDVFNLPSLYHSDKLDEQRKVILKMEFPITQTEVHKTGVIPPVFSLGQECLSFIVNQIMKKARLTCSFSELYPMVEKYVLNRCFEVKIDNIENPKLVKHLNDIAIQEAIIELLAREIGLLTAEAKETIIEKQTLKLSKIPPFTWRRKHLRCKKTVFNFVAVFNNFEAEFAQFLDKCEDIVRFASLAEKFKIDYLSSRGAIRFYYPDFVAVQKERDKEVFWIIETKGREYEETQRKEEAVKVK